MNATLFVALIATIVAVICAYLLRHRLLGVLRKPVRILFHHFYYYDGSSTWAATHWLGTPILKLPMDVWTYQEILYETQPDLIIEAGTSKGGSTRFFANLFELLGKGRIVSIDISHPAEGLPQHPRIEYLLGSSSSPDIMREVKSRIKSGERVMVILDSDHSQKHVAAELELYHSLVTPGCYMVVEDSNVNGHPVYRSLGPGPMEALDDFLPRHPEFKSDLSRERHGITFFPRGWLLRS